MMKVLSIACFLFFFTEVYAGSVTFTKTYRCVATAEKISVLDPMEAQTGQTTFDDSFFPFNFQTNDKATMDSYVALYQILFQKLGQ